MAWKTILATIDFYVHTKERESNKRVNDEVSNVAITMKSQALKLEEALNHNNTLRERHALEVEKVHKAFSELKAKHGKLEQEHKRLLDQIAEKSDPDNMHPKRSGNLYHSINKLEYTIEMMEKVNTVQDKLINSDLNQAFEIALRKNKFFREAGTQTDLTTEQNHATACKYELKPDDANLNCRFAQLVAHPFEAFITRDFDTRMLVESSNNLAGFADLLERFIIDPSPENLQIIDPRILFVKFLSKSCAESSSSELSVPPEGQKSTSLSSFAKLPSICLTLTKMTAIFMRDKYTSMEAKLFCNFFGVGRSPGLTPLEWANFSFFKKLLHSYMARGGDGERSVLGIPLKTPISKADIQAIARMTAQQVKVDLDFDSITAELLWQQVKSTVRGGLLTGVAKADIPANHLLHFLVEKSAPGQNKIPEVLENLIRQFERLDHESFGFITMQQLQDMIEQEFKFKLQDHTMFNDVWFKPYTQNSILFDYQTFLYHFMRFAFKGKVDPAARNPEIFVEDLYMMKLKFLRKVLAVERLRIRHAVSIRLQTFDLDGLSELLYSKPYSQTSDLEKDVVIQAISAARGVYELKSQGTQSLQLRSMPEETKNSIFERISEYLQANQENLLERILSQDASAPYR